MFKQGARIAGFISLGLLAFYLVFRSQPNPQGESLLSRLINDFQQAEWLYLFVMAGAFMLSNVFRALRWQQMLQPMGVRLPFLNSISAIMVAYLTNLVIPRAGEIARATSIAGTSDISFEKALGTVVLDRILDMICLLIIAILTLAMASDLIFAYFDQHFDLQKRWQGMNQGKALLFLILTFGLLIFAFFVISRTAWYNLKLKARINLFVSGLWEGLSSIKNIEKPATFLFYTVAIWFLYFFMAFILFKALDSTAHLGPVAGLVVFFFGSLGIVFPSPGGMGSYHFLAIESLSLYNIDARNAFTYANLSFFTIQVFTIITFGIAGLIVLASGKSKKTRASA